jgi:hypothetical protein
MKKGKKNEQYESTTKQTKSICRWPQGKQASEYQSPSKSAKTGTATHASAEKIVIGLTE